MVIHLKQSKHAIGSKRRTYRKVNGKRRLVEVTRTRTGEKVKVLGKTRKYTPYRGFDINYTKQLETYYAKAPKLSKQYIGVGKSMDETFGVVTDRIDNYMRGNMHVYAQNKPYKVKKKR